MTSDGSRVDSIAGELLLLVSAGWRDGGTGQGSIGEAGPRYSSH